MNETKVYPCQKGDVLGSLYVESFPQSVQFFFPGKKEEELISLAGCAFELLLRGGCYAFIAARGDEALGYAVASSGKPLLSRLFSPDNLAGTLALLGGMASRLRAPELFRLTGNRLFFYLNLRRPNPPTRPVGHLVSIAVRPGVRGRGLGRLLLRHCIEYLDQLGIPAIVLECRPNNIAARTLYESEGFEVWGRTRDLQGEWLQMIRVRAKSGSGS